jgi:hypothetical protein
MAVNAGAVTLIVAVSLTVPEVTVMVAVPTFRAVANPALLIEATAPEDVVQTVVPVMLWVFWSLKVPVTVNCSVFPLGTDELEGESESETKLGADTLRVAVPLTDPDLAVMVAIPACFATAIPGELMAAIAGWTLLHWALWVKSRALPSL